MAARDSEYGGTCVRPWDTGGTGVRGVALVVVWRTFLTGAICGYWMYGVMVL